MTQNSSKKDFNKIPKDPSSVAVYSNRNIYWDEVGRVSKGYTIVTLINSEKWITISGVRIATPEEVAGAYSR